MKSVKNFLSHYQFFSVISAIIFFVVGILFIVFNSHAKATLLYIFSISLMVAGVFHLINYVISKAFATNIILGAFEFITGLVVLLLIPNLKNTNVFGIVFGIYFVLIGLFVCDLAIDGKKQGVSKWWMSLVFAVILLSAGFVFIFVKSAENVVAILAGCALIFDAGYAIIDAIMVSRNAREYTDTLKDLLN